MNLIFSTSAEGLDEYVRRSTTATGLGAPTPSEDAVHAAYFKRNGKFYSKDFYGLPKHYGGIWNDGMWVAPGARRMPRSPATAGGGGEDGRAHTPE